MGAKTGRPQPAEDLSQKDPETKTGSSLFRILPVMEIELKNEKYGLKTKRLRLPSLPLRSPRKDHTPPSSLSSSSAGLLFTPSARLSPQAFGSWDSLLDHREPSQKDPESSSCSSQFSSDSFDEAYSSSSSKEDYLYFKTRSQTFSLPGNFPTRAQSAPLVPPSARLSPRPFRPWDSLFGSLDSLFRSWDSLLDHREPSQKDPESSSCSSQFSIDSFDEAHSWMPRTRPSVTPRSSISLHKGERQTQVTEMGVETGRPQPAEDLSQKDPETKTGSSLFRTISRPSFEQYDIMNMVSETDESSCGSFNKLQTDHTPPSSLSSSSAGLLFTPSARLRPGPFRPLDSLFGSWDSLLDHRELSQKDPESSSCSSQFSIDSFDEALMVAQERNATRSSSSNSKEEYLYF